jgi:ubiquinone/menaquinone biosynthesis C-methylase UbiE
MGVVADMRTDYDEIAHLYDENPLRRKDVDDDLVRYLAMDKTRSLSSIRVVDIACGTGNQAVANKTQFPEVEMWGVDRSAGMLAQAKRKSQEIRWIQADMDETDLTLGEFDYASCQFAYHHSQAKRRFMENAYRNLRQGGWFTITNLDVYQMADWYVYHYFPAAKTLDWQDFLTQEHLLRIVQSVGFEVLSCETTRHLQRMTATEVYHTCESRQGTSELMAIDDMEYEKGMEALRERFLQDGSAILESHVAILHAVLKKP